MYILGTCAKPWIATPPLCTAVSDNRMTRTTLTLVLQTLLLWSALLAPALAQKLEMLPGEYNDDTWQSEAERTAEQSLRQAIEQLETSQGAYGSDLSEQMLSLGLTLQQQQRHLEAVDAFKRGVHLARINSGLYCPDQIPLLQGEVKSHIALGQYAEADELQQYLYRVQLRSMEVGEARADALVQQANWQFNAHRLGLGWQGPGRLRNMWDLYHQAFNDILAVEGESSPKLLPPLYGMLRTQYLVQDYRSANVHSAKSPGAEVINENVSRFYSDRRQNYSRGQAIVSAIYDVQRSNHGVHSVEAFDAMVQLGDWALWNGQQDEAVASYRDMLTELASADVAQVVPGRYFAEPVPLPDLVGLRSLPQAVSAEQGNILVEFGVDSRGRVRDLQRLDENEDIDDAASGLLRVLRDTRFRPRFEANEPHDTVGLTRAYDIKP